MCPIVGDIARGCGRNTNPGWLAFPKPGNAGRGKGPQVEAMAKGSRLAGVANGLVVRHVIIFGYGHGLQRAIIDESQHRTPERLVMAQH